MTRKIVHLDLDAFFCAVEELSNPSLIGRPFAVGGRPEERGVVASCSYPARKFGVRSAMPMARALRLCPELTIVSSHYSEYVRLSKKMIEYVYELSPIVEQVSIDEAFVDVTQLDAPARKSAEDLQCRINQELNLPCSFGVAANKLVAKIANDAGKAAVQGDKPPNAITVVKPGEEAEFLAPLPVDRLWGVGPKTADRLRNLGVLTIGDLASYSETELIHKFGKNGLYLAWHAKGIDDSPLITTHEIKSISQEVTFARDVRELGRIHATLRSQAEQVGRRLRERNLSGSTVKIKVRWPDFTTLTRQLTLSAPTDQDEEIFQAAQRLFSRIWEPGKAVRLVGVGVTGFQSSTRQLSLWDVPDQRSDLRRDQLNAAIDELRSRYGDSAVRFAADNRKK